MFSLDATLLVATTTFNITLLGALMIIAYEDDVLCTESSKMNCDQDFILHFWVGEDLQESDCKIDFDLKI